MSIRKDLEEMGDKKVADFSAKLTPNVDSKLFIGIKVPKLREYAKKIHGTKEADEFLNKLPHKYHEENMLHSILLNTIKDYDKVIEELDRFLPYVTNWMVCDTISPKVFNKKEYKEDLKKHARRWMKDKKTYTARFGMDVVMTFFLDDDFDAKLLKETSKLRGEDYYFKMMQAWLFATALAKQREETLPYFEKKILDDWTHNKAIQKAKESYRISDRDKEYLNSLKVESKKKK